MKNRNIFQGERLQLTAFSQQDAEQLAQFSEDAEYLRNLDTDFALPRDSAYYKGELAAQNKNMLQFALRLPDKTLLGFVALHSIEWNNRCCLLAIGIGNVQYRGQGYGGEALQLILNYAFNELNLNRVGLDVISSNQAALACYQRAGFTVEGTAREAVLRDGKKYDKIYMGILEYEWRNGRSNPL